MGGSLPKGWVLFSVFLPFTMKESPRHVYSDSTISLKQLIGQTVMFNRTTTGLKLSPDGTQCSEWHHVTTSMAHCISYVCFRKTALYMACSRGGHSFPIQEIGPRVAWFPSYGAKHIVDAEHKFSRKLNVFTLLR